MFTTSARNGARTAAKVAAAACAALLTLGISSATALASPTEEVPTASSALAVSDATTSSTEAVGSETTAPAKTVAATCEGQTFGQPFEAFGDYNYYTLVNGSQFESPEEGWTLSGGARIAPTSRPDGSAGGVLQLPRGSQAVSPPLCVTLLYPTARVWLQAQSELRGVLQTQVLYSKAKGSAVAKTVAKLQTETSWSPSEPFEVRPELGGEAEGPRPVRFVFTSRGSRESTLNVYELYVDPRMR